jgi:hypothetical protein
MNPMGAELPRRYKARYAGTMAGEIKKNVVLAPGEEIVDSQLVRQRKNWLISQLRLLALTHGQLILLKHNLFTADWIVQIPRSAITQVTFEETAMNAWAKFTYLDSAESRTVSLQPMMRRPSKEETRKLFDLLQSFHQASSIVSP